MTQLRSNELPDFIENSSPASATVSRTISEVVLAAANRTRRIRAWVRFAGALGLLAAAVTSGSPRWWLALPWFTAVGLTVLHAYRDSLATYHRNWGSPAPRFAAFVGRHLLTNYSVKPSPNKPGVVDFVGCVWGMVISGQLFASFGLALFDLTDPDQAAGATAGGVLAAIVLVGGAQIVTNSYSWQTVEVEHDRAYRRAWAMLTLLATIIVTAALWPGLPSERTGYATRVALDIGAAGATVFTCYFGRMSVSRQIGLLYRQLTETKKAIRRSDGAKVHIARGRATAARMWLEAVGEPKAANLVDSVVLELGLVEDELKNDHELSAGERRARSVNEIYTQWVSGFVAAQLVQQSWTGVVRDVALTKANERDVEFIDMAVRNLVSNAVNQQARDFSLAVYPVISSDHHTTVVVEARCVCSSRFDGTALPAGHGLEFLRDSVVGFKGHFAVDESAEPGAGGDHVVRLDWTTPALLREIDPHAELEPTS